MKLPTCPSKNVDVTVHQSTLTNGNDSKHRNVCRAAVISDQIEKEHSWLVNNDEWLLSLFAWHDNVNAKVESLAGGTGLSHPVGGGPFLTEQNVFTIVDPQGLASICRCS